MSTTFTTGQASSKLGMLITAKFIESLGITPADKVKGNPIWHTSDWNTLLDGIEKHLNTLTDNPPGAADKPAPKPKATTKPVASAPAAAPYTDDEDDDL